MSNTPEDPDTSGHSNGERSADAGSNSSRSSFADRIDKAAVPLEAGMTLGDYRLLQMIGRGGMGVVFQAIDERSGQSVAIKVLSPAVARDTKVLKRFQREAETGARLAHPHIVEMLDASESQGLMFLVMGFVEGENLSAYVRHHGPLPVSEALSCVLQAARGLSHAHAAGVVHRDVKPSNLIRSPDGVVKVLDLGLARVLDDDGQAPTELTSTGTMFGTVDYMAPEQARDSKRADARSDLYSLGCALHFLLTGKAVYGGDSMLTKIRAHLDQPIPDIPTLRGDTPQAVQRIFQKLVAKKPEDRFQTADELIVELERIIQLGDTVDPEATRIVDPELMATTITTGEASDSASARRIGASARTGVKSAKGLVVAGVLLLAGLITGGVVWSRRSNPATNSESNGQPPAAVVSNATETDKPTMDVLPVKPDTPASQLDGTADKRQSNLSTSGNTSLPTPLPPLTIAATEGFPPLVSEANSEDELRAQQQRWAEKLQVSVTFQDSIGLKAAVIPPGSFPRRWAAGSPQHRVWVTQPFAMSTTEVTWDQFRQFVEATGYRTEVEQNGKGGRAIQVGSVIAQNFEVVQRPDIVWKTPAVLPVDPQTPVVQVSWRDAVEFCAWLSRKEQVTYRLPTEAEWELAAAEWLPRGDLNESGWVDRLHNRPSAEQQHSASIVGLKKSNVWGLHDTFGNVWEWCADEWSGAENLDANNPISLDPQGPKPVGRAERVLRGWCFGSQPIPPEVSRQIGIDPTAEVGFRVVREFPRQPGLSPQRPELVASGTALSPRALVGQPAVIPGVRSWSVELAGHTNTVADIATSPIDGRVATASSDASVRVWNATGQLQHLLLGNPRAATSVGWSTNGRWLASGGSDPVVRVWELDSGRLLHVIPAIGWNGRVKWSPKEPRVAFAAVPAVVVLDVLTGRTQTSQPVGHFADVAWSGDGRRLAGAASGPKIWIWNSETMSIEKELTVSEKPVQSLAWCPTSDLLATSSDDGRVRLWDTRTWEQRHEFDHRQSREGQENRQWRAGQIEWSHRGDKLVCALSKLVVWDVSGRELFNVPMTGEGRAAWSFDDRQLVVSSGRGYRIVNATSGQPEGLDSSADLATPSAATVAISADGTRVVTRRDRELTLWDAETGDLLPQRFGGLPPGAVSPSPDGKWLAIFANLAKSQLTLVDAETTQIRKPLSGHTQGIANVAWSPDGAKLASSSPDKTVRVWDVAKGETLRKFEGFEPGAHDLEWSLDGTLLGAVSPSEKWLLVWNVETGEIVRELKGVHRGWYGPSILTWQKDRDHVTLGFADRAIRSFDLRTGFLSNWSQQPTSENAHQGLSSSPDRSQLVLHDLYQSTFLWTDRTKEWKHLGFLGGPGYWHADGKRFFLGTWIDPVLRAFDATNAKQLGVLIPNMSKTQSVCIGPTGHYRGSRRIDDALVYVAQLEDGSNRTYTPADFAKTFGWKNDPEQASFLRPLVQKTDVDDKKTGEPGGVSPRTMTGGASQVRGLTPPGSPDARILPKFEIAADVSIVEVGQPLTPESTVTMPPPVTGLRSWSLEPVRSFGDQQALAVSLTGQRTAVAGDDAIVRIYDGDLQLENMLVGHRGPIRSLAWAADGYHLASTGDDGTVRVWDAETGRAVRAIVLAGGTNGAQFGRCVAWSPTEPRLAVAATGGLCFEIDLSTQRRRSWSQGEDPFAIAWSADGRQVAVGCYASVVRVWDVETLQLVREIRQSLNAVVSVAWSADGRWIAVGHGTGGVGRVSVFDAATGHVKFHGSLPIEVGRQVAFSPQSDRLVSAGSRVQMWDVATGQLLGHSRDLGIGGNVAWMPDGRSLVSQTALALQQHDAASWKLLRQGPQSPNFSGSRVELAAAADLAMTSRGNEATFWKASSGEFVRRLIDFVWGPQALSPDGNWFLDLDHTGGQPRFYLVDSATGENRRQLTGHTLGIRAAAWSSDSQKIATASNDTTICIWDRDSASLKQTLKSHSAPVTSIAWSPDGTRLASSGEDKVIKLWDAASGVVLKQFDKVHSLSPKGLAFSPDGKRLAVLSPEEGFLTLELDTGERGPLLVRGVDANRSLHWSPDGRSVLGPTPYGNAVLSLDSLELQPLRTADQLVAWTSDGQRVLVSQTLKNIAHVFDVATDQRTATLFYTLDDNNFATIAGHGHYRGSVEAEQHLRYIALRDDGRQETLTASAFREKCGWQNDPQQVRFCAAPESLAAAPASEQSLTASLLKEFPLEKPAETNIAVSAGQPISPRALVGQPAPISGLRSWSIEPRWQRYRITSLAHHPSGKVIASGGTSETTIRIWNEQLEVQSLWLGHTEAIVGLAWSPDGRRLASASNDKTVKVWEFPTGRLLQSFVPHEQGWANCLAWNGDGTRLFVGSYSALKVIDVARAEIRGFDWPGGQVTATAWSAVGPRLAIAHETGALRIVDPESLQVQKELKLSVDAATSIGWSHDGRWLAATSHGANPTVEVWDSQTWELKHSFRPGRQCDQLAWSPKLPLLAGTSYQGVTLWNVETGQAVASAPIQAYNLTWSPDGQSLCFTDQPGNLSRYSTDKLGFLNASAVANKIDINVEVRADVTSGQLAQSRWGTATELGVTDARSGRRLRREVHPGISGHLAVSDGRMIVWDLYAPQNNVFLTRDNLSDQRRPLAGHTGIIRAAAWSPDHKFFATASDDQTVRLWDAVGTAKHVLQHGQPVGHVAWSWDGRTLATATVDTIRLWNATTAELQKEIKPQHGGMHSGDFGLAWAKDSRSLLVASSHRDLLRLDLESFAWSPATAFPDGSGINGVAVSPATGAIIASSTPIKGLVFTEGQPQPVSFGPSCFPQWLHEGRSVLVGDQVHLSLRIHDAATGQVRGTFLPGLPQGGQVWIGPTGHCRASPGVEVGLVYVALFDDGHQESFTPAAFRTKFGWKNDPELSTLTHSKP